MWRACSVSEWLECKCSQDIETVSIKGGDLILVLNLPSELERQLASEAAKRGLPLPDYVLQLLAAGHESCRTPATGADLLEYWRSEGLIGYRHDITDSQAHARAIQKQAEARPRP